MRRGAGAIKSLPYAGSPAPDPAGPRAQHYTFGGLRERLPNCVGFVVFTNAYYASLELMMEAT